MRIIGCDLHTRQQTIAMLDTDTGEFVNETLQHDGEELRKFYSGLSRPVLVGSKRLEIDYQEFCRRGKARQESGSVRAGMPGIHSGPATS